MTNQIIKLAEAQAITEIGCVQNLYNVACRHDDGRHRHDYAPAEKPNIATENTDARLSEFRNQAFRILKVISEALRDVHEDNRAC